MPAAVSGHREDWRAAVRRYWKGIVLFSFHGWVWVLSFNGFDADQGVFLLVIGVLPVSMVLSCHISEVQDTASVWMNC